MSVLLPRPQGPWPKRIERLVKANGYKVEAVQAMCEAVAVADDRTWFLLAFPAHRGHAASWSIRYHFNNCNGGGGGPSYSNRDLALDAFRQMAGLPVDAPQAFTWEQLPLF